jgi:hypothetical protein
MVTRNPLACSNLPNEAEIMPFPSEEVTPPVTNIYFATDIKRLIVTGCKGMVLGLINYVK